MFRSSTGRRVVNAPLVEKRYLLQLLHLVRSFLYLHVTGWRRICVRIWWGGLSHPPSFIHPTVGWRWVGVRTLAPSPPSWLEFSPSMVSDIFEGLMVLWMRSEEGWYYSWWSIPWDNSWIDDSTSMGVSLSSLHEGQFWGRIDQLEQSIWTNQSNPSWTNQMTYSRRWVSILHRPVPAPPFWCGCKFGKKIMSRASGVRTVSIGWQLVSTKSCIVCFSRDGDFAT